MSDPVSHIIAARENRENARDHVYDVHPPGNGALDLPLINVEGFDYRLIRHRPPNVQTLCRGISHQPETGRIILEGDQK